MKTKLSKGELVFTASMLFGLFFGAGNLIFPIHMGQLAGENLIPAIIGFLITGVGLPLLGVTAIGISRSDGLIELSGKVSKSFCVFFTCALYLTIGPFFAIPRCATVPFTVGIEPLLGGRSEGLPLALFSLAFFIAVLGFSLYPGKILTWVGKILNPLFLLFLGVLIAAALIYPMGNPSGVEAVGSYKDSAFVTGFFEGYNTMDALAGLAFGIVVVNVIREHGITEANDVAKNTVKAGVFSCLLMAVIYALVALVGAESRGVYEICKNGGEVFALVAGHYFGNGGKIILAVMFTFACLKTAVGLVTSCSETFEKLFPEFISYRAWTVIFSIVSFLIANLGLNTIIEYSVPVLMFLYPLAIVLILLGLFGRFFKNSKYVYRCVTGFTFIAAFYDLIHSFYPNGCRLTDIMECFLPFADYGLAWIAPAAVGLGVGLILYFRKKA